MRSVPSLAFLLFSLRPQCRNDGWRSNSHFEPCGALMIKARSSAARRQSEQNRRGVWSCQSSPGILTSGLLLHENISSCVCTCVAGSLLLTAKHEFYLIHSRWDHSASPIGCLKASCHTLRPFSWEHYFLSCPTFSYIGFLYLKPDFNPPTTSSLNS